jgi:hypothetical protein
MQRKKLSRTFEVTVERSERITVHRDVPGRLAWCEVCGQSEHFEPAYNAARAVGSDQREIFRCVEAGDVGFVELSEGSILICLRCAARAKTKEKTP